MLVEEYRCIGCDREHECSERCNYGKQEVYYCDKCDNYAKYRIDDIDMCKECAENYCDEVWNGFAIEDKCEMLNLFFDRRY